jgi:hypothetical protein
LAVPPGVVVTPVATQDFDALSDAGTLTTDSLPSGVQLTNAGSRNIGGPGLDFSTTWFDTRGEGTGPVTTVGDSSDFIGVNSFTGSNAPDVAPGGAPVASGVEHNFEFNDGDGALVLRFESVDVSGLSNRYLSLNYWIAPTGYEADDALTISVSNGGLGIVLLGYGETELEANVSADDGTDNWKTLEVDLDALLASSGLDPSNLILSIAADTNASVENIFVDNVSFETRVPSVIVDAGGPYEGNEGAAIPIMASASSGSGAPLSYLWSSADPSCAFADPTAAMTAVTCADNGAYTLTVIASDGSTSASDTAELMVNNVPPIVTITSPADGAVLPISTAVQVLATLADPGSADTHTCMVDFGDGTSEAVPCDTTNGITASPHTYGEAGVFEIWVTATDDDGGTTMVGIMIVIYDPSAGFVTGGGWIDSPPGAYVPDPGLEGKANFGFVSKYHKGATAPDGNTEFVFHAADLNFHSDSYEWLVVAGGKAQFKGVGTINGFGNYGFLIFATDGEATPSPVDEDRFRIKIWDVDNGDAPVYDNGPAQPLGGGSIVVHTGGKGRTR